MADIHFAKLHFHIVFREYLTGYLYFYHKTGIILTSASKKKINNRLAFVYYPNGNKMDHMIGHMVRNYITCYCIPTVRIAWLELLFGTHTFNFNCFLMILIACLRKYAAYLDC